MKRRVTDAQLRDLVRLRLTKGDAFRYPLARQYEAEQERVRRDLASLTRSEIFARYPHHTYDLRP